MESVIKMFRFSIKINDLCRTPKPIIISSDKRFFVSSIFKYIKDLCRTPELLTTIEVFLVDDQYISPEICLKEQKLFKKRNEQYYVGSKDKKIE